MNTYYNELLFSILLFVFVSSSLFAQNIGVGTLAPSEKLHVNGNLRVDSLGSNGDGIVKTDNTGKLSTVPFPNDPNQVLQGDGSFSEIQSINGFSRHFISLNPSVISQNFIYDGTDFKLWYSNNNLFF